MTTPHQPSFGLFWALSFGRSLARSLAFFLRRRVADSECPNRQEGGFSAQDGRSGAEPGRRGHGAECASQCLLSEVRATSPRSSDRLAFLSTRKRRIRSSDAYRIDRASRAPKIRQRGNYTQFEEHHSPLSLRESLSGYESLALFKRTRWSTRVSRVSPSTASF